jgi:hypothetical protein
MPPRRKSDAASPAQPRGGSLRDGADLGRRRGAGPPGIIETGYQEEVASLFPIYVDNGTKTPAIQEIHDRMQGTAGYAGNAAGADRYAPFDGYNDSWVPHRPHRDRRRRLRRPGGLPGPRALSDPATDVGTQPIEPPEDPQ